MDFEDAYRIADTILFAHKSRHLSEAEVIILQGACQGQSYEEIAAHSRYSLNYLKRDVGPKFWRLLSDVLNEPVSKTNFLAALERHRRLAPEPTLPPEPPPLAHEPVPFHRRQKRAKVQKDWGEAVDNSVFFGRRAELVTLKQWILQEGCRLIAILGMGGIGKTALSVTLADQTQGRFDFLIWRSLRHMPPFDDILYDFISLLSDEQDVDIPSDKNAAITLLLKYLRQNRCLLILDGIESILQPGDRTGRYVKDYEEYGELFSRIGLERHKSCLVVTSREKSKEFTVQEGETLPVRSLQLEGLDEAAGREILETKGIFALDDEWTTLIQQYRGNPYALKIAATTIKDIFNHKISDFLAQNTLVFDGISRILEKQFERLSPSEQRVIYWLAVNREDVTLGELREDVVSPILQTKLLDCLYALGRRSLIDNTPAGFTLQPIVLEYVTKKLVEELCQELQTQKINIFSNIALVKAQSKDYIRDAQIKQVLVPVIERLKDTAESTAQVRNRLLQVIANRRNHAPVKLRYLAGNILNLLRELQVDVSATDFSHLPIWQACLQDMTLHQINFQQSNLAKSTFTENLGNVLSLAYGVTAPILAAGDDTGLIHLWDTETGTKLNVLKGHESWIRSIAFSSTQAILASGSQDQSVKLWNIVTGACLKTLQDPELDNQKSHKDWVRAVAFSPDGKTVVSCGDDYRVRLWSVETGQLLHRFDYINRIRSVAFSPDSSLLAGGSDDHLVELWDVKTGQQLRTLQGHADWVRSVAFHPNGQTLASGSDDQTIKLWDVQTGRLLNTLQGHTDWVRSVAFSPDGHHLASSSDDYTVKIWQTQTGECQRTLAEHLGMVWSVTFNHDGQVLASGGDDQTIRQWEVQTGQCLKTIDGYTAGIRSVAFNPDGKTLAIGSNDHTVTVWNIAAENYLTFSPGHRGRVWSVAFSPDGLAIASGSDDKTIKLWDAQSGECLETFTRHTNYVRSVVFSPDGTLLASSGHDKTIHLWDAQTREYIQSLEGHNHWIRCITFSPDSQLLASCSDEQIIKLWDIKTGDCVRTLQKHEHRIRAIAFSPTGRTLASASDDKTIKLWDVATGQDIQTLSGHILGVQAVTFHPAGQILASGSDDKTVKLWDVATGTCIKTLGGHEHWVRTVAFSPDGQFLASGSQDETIRIWDVQTGQESKVLRTPRPYEGMNITGATGLSDIQKSTLKALGAIESGSPTPI